MRLPPCRTITVVSEPGHSADGDGDLVDEMYAIQKIAPARVNDSTKSNKFAGSTKYRTEPAHVSSAEVGSKQAQAQRRFKQGSSMSGAKRHSFNVEPTSKGVEGDARGRIARESAVQLG